MSDTNEDKPFIGREATGIYQGKLVEDMIETVAREKKLYCNVLIPEFFAEGSNYPLTYVPFWAFSLPLRKDDIVLVEFHQSNLMYPVLYKNESEIDEGFFEQFDVGQSVEDGNIEAYEPLDTIGAQKIGVDSYIIKTEDYTVIHQNNGFILIDKEDKIYHYGSEINMISSGKVNIDAAEDIQLYTGANCSIRTKEDTKFEIKGSCSIETESDCSIKTKGSTNIEAQSECKIETKAACSISAETTCKVTAKGGFTVNNHLQVTQ